MLHLEVILCLFIYFPWLSNASKLNKFTRNAVIEDVKSEGPVLWHNYKFNAGVGNREELTIENIIADDEFGLGQEVVEWQTVNLKTKSFAVGRMDSGFTIMISELNVNQTFSFTSKLLVLEEDPTAYSMYKFWNSDRMEYNVYFVFVTTSDKPHLQWFRISENLELENLQPWSLKDKVSHLRIFEASRYTKVLIIYEQSFLSGSATAEIYDIVFEENNFNFRLFYTINLNCSSKTSAINYFANNVFISIPQQISNRVEVYKLAKTKFEYFETIRSENVAVVSDFMIGHHSFLAVGGFGSGIYQITKQGLLRRNVHINFNEVTYYLPLRVNTYRDEVFLVVQHRIDYISHTAPQVRVLIYSRDEFHAHDEAPCSYLGQNLYGATCLVDPERESGIIGSAMLNLGKTLAILTPGHQIQSGLFYVKWKLIQVDNPMAEKVSRIIQSRIRIQGLLNQQRRDIQEIRYRLNDALKINSENEIKGNWKVNTVVVPNVHNPNMKYNDQDEYQNKFETFPFRSNFMIITDDIESLQVKILQTRSTETGHDFNFDHLKVNGKFSVNKEIHVENLSVENVNDLHFDSLVEDCVRRSRRNIITGTKTFKQSDIERLNFAKLNNVSAENIAYNTRYGVQVRGSLTFKNILQVKENVGLLKDGKLNDINVKNELFSMGSGTIFKSLNFRNLSVNNLNHVKSVNDLDMNDIIKYDGINQGGLNIEMDYLDLSNVKVETEYIDDQELTNFISNLCLRNTECKFPKNTTIHGKMHIKGAVDINFLNELQYPNEYILKEQTDGFIKITGKKIFFGNISTTEVVVTGLVDGVDPDEVITCTTSQTVLGNITFTDLEITESFRVDGDIFIGPNLTKFIPNPTLEDSKFIESNIFFAQLEIDGPILVSNLFNGDLLETVLDDVVYKDEEIVSIDAEKKFTNKLNIHNNLKVESGIINEMKIRDILTTDSEQIVPNKNIDGKVIIENLKFEGLFDDKNLISHFQQLIRLDEDETIKSDLILNNVEDVPDIIASKLQIININNKTASDFILITGNRNLDDVEFKSLKANNVEILEDLQYEIECFDIDDFYANRFSLTIGQTITGNMRIVNGSAEKIRTESINDVEWNLIVDYLNISDIFFEKFVTAQFNIEGLHIKKSITLQDLNGKNFDSIRRDIFWTNMSNDFINNVEFKSDVTVNELVIKKQNGIDFDRYINDFIAKSEKDVVMIGYKYFQNEIVIHQDLETQSINELPVEKILLRSAEQSVSGHLTIHGDLWIVNDLHVDKYINNVASQYFRAHFKTVEDTFIILGNISFQEHVLLDNLRVNGSTKSKNLATYINNIVGIYDDIIINTTTVFRKKVRVLENLEVVRTIDGVNVDNALQNIVLISSDGNIQELVAFRQDVEIADTVILETDLDTKYLCGCNVQEWLDKAAYINNGYFPGKVIFNSISLSKNLDVDNINDTRMNDLIPLHSDQTINTTLEARFVKSEEDVEVGSFVNGYNIEDEYKNTVMTNKDQDLSSFSIFLKPVTISHNLKTHGLVNGKDLARLVTINTDQNLTASYSINNKVIINSHLNASGRINGIEILDWVHRTITVSGENEQIIEDKWKSPGRIIFKGDVTSDGLLGGTEMKKAVRIMGEKQNRKYEIENIIKMDYKSICTSVQNLVKIGAERPFIFRYLEYHDDIYFDHDLSAIHHLQSKSQHYLIISQKYTCHSLLYKWVTNSFKFTSDLITGEVEQFITVRDSDYIYLVARNVESTSCKNIGINIWIFNENSLMHIRGFDQSVMLHESELPGTFYTLENKSITEYKVFYKDKNAAVDAYRQWDTPNGNILSYSNLALYEESGSRKLRQGYIQTDDSYSDNEPIIDHAYLTVHYMPSMNIKHVEFYIGANNTVKKFTAVAIWEEATIEGHSDEIKIYESSNKWKLFDKLVTRRPSNLNILQFDSSEETFLAFLEDYKILKLYTFAESQGLYLRSETNIAATKMITISLPVQPFQSKRKFLLLVNKNAVTLFQGIMYGDRPTEKFHCGS